MAYNTNTPRAEYTASATQTVFPFLFKIFTTSDIKVYQTLAGATPDDVADILVLTTDYTVTINGDAGGEVTLNTGAAVNDKITLARNLSVTRATEYQQNGDLLASTLNSDQEYQTYLIADNVSNDSRYIKVPDSVQNVSTSLPAPVSDAYIKWNATADAIENDTTIPDAVTTSAANAAAAVASATQAQLYEWEAEAERLTADSYATEAEDTFVNIVTSDGDGTFTYTPTTDYSALHWSAKAATFNPAIYAPIASPALTNPTINGIAQSGYSGFKNLIINGNPIINQRGYVSGTATTSANEYTLDRWRVVTSGQSLTFSTTANVTTMTLPAGGIEQVIEGLNFQSGTYTISFVSTGDIVCAVDGVTKASGDTFTLTGGTNATVKFSSALGTGTVKLIQVEKGSVATPFEQEAKSITMSKCEWYYRILSCIVRCLSDASTDVRHIEPYPEMRTVPTVTSVLFRTTGGTNVAYTPTANASTYLYGRVLYYSVTSTGTAGQPLYSKVILNAEL